MTTVEVLYRYATPPADRVALALARARDIYGIRQFVIDSLARTVRVEFDASRLNIPAVSKILLEAGLDLVAQLPLVPSPAPAPVPAPVA